MAVKLNGTTGHLYIDASPIVAYPYAIVGWDSNDFDGNAFPYTASYGQSAAEYFDVFAHYAGTNQYAL